MRLLVETVFRILLPEKASAKMQKPEQICKNCKNPKKHHHYKDAFCLLTMNWKPEEFAHLSTKEELSEYLMKLRPNKGATVKRMAGTRQHLHIH